MKIIDNYLPFCLKSNFSFGRYKIISPIEAKVINAKPPANVYDAFGFPFTLWWAPMIIAILPMIRRYNKCLAFLFILELLFKF